MRQKELIWIIQYSEWWWLDDLASVLDKGKNFYFCHIQAGLGVQSLDTGVSAPWVKVSATMKLSSHLCTMLRSRMCGEAITSHIFITLTFLDKAFSM